MSNLLLAGRSLGLALTVAAALVGCDTGTGPADCVPGRDPECTAPAGDEVVAGVNLDALFAAPTPAERDSAVARLERTGGTDAPRVTGAVATELAPDPDATRYVLVELRGDDGTTLTRALARVPARDGGPDVPLPVVVLAAGGAGSTSEADFLTGAVQGLDRRTVQVVLAARGATLTARGRTYAPTAPADPYRADALDLLALVDRLGSVVRADPDRVALVGVGRGGTAVLLAAERVPGRLAAVSSLGAPTSLFAASFRNTARRLLQGEPSRLPAADVLLAPVVALRDGRISLAEARLRLVELSPALFADRLPATLAFHADPDNVVPTDHLDRFREQGEGPLDARRRFVTVPEGRHETLLRENEVQSLLADFLLAEL